VIVVGRTDRCHSHFIDDVAYYGMDTDMTDGGRDSVGLYVMIVFELTVKYPQNTTDYYFESLDESINGLL